MGLRPDWDVIVTSRDLARAQAFCDDHGGRAMALDLDDPSLNEVIAKVAPFVIVDAAGPYQDYGDRPYRVAEAALACGAHYLDLSDDAGFTTGISALDTAAKAAGVTLLSGVSSVPALSSAAVQHLREGLDYIDLVESAILPGNRAPRGLAVMQSILGQVGRPSPTWIAGRTEPVPAWSDLQREKLVIEGQRPLSPRWSSPIGAPDLALFADYFGAASVRFRAGLELSIMHLGLAVMALPVRWGLIRSLAPLARPLHLAADLLEPFGTDRGGMRVTVVGRQADTILRRDWTLIAASGDGPHIPALPARIVLNRLADGAIAPGARPCLAEFDLDAFRTVAPDLDLSDGTTETEIVPIFQTALGTDWDKLPAPLRDLHTVPASRRWSGTAQVTRGNNPLARVICRLFGFPPAAQDIPVTVTMTRRGDKEIWTRRFGTRIFRSHLRVGRGGFVTERFGPFRFELGLNVAEGALHYPVRRGWFLGLPWPRALLPRSAAVEQVTEDGDAQFDVALSAPLAGPLVRYRGTLRPDEG